MTNYGPIMEKLAAHNVPAGDDDTQVADGGLCVYEHRGRALAYMVGRPSGENADEAAKMLREAGVTPAWADRDIDDWDVAIALLGGTVQLAVRA